MPILITQEQFDHAMAVLRKDILLDPYLIELKDFIKDNFGYDVFDFYMEENFSDCNVKNKTRINMLLNKQLSYQENRYRRKLDLINKKMIELNLKYKFIPDNNLYESIGFYSFKPIYEAECVKKASEFAIPVLKQKYQAYHISDIIYSGYGIITVFYMTIADTDKNKREGINDQIEIDFLAYLPEVDELGWVDLSKTYITFDSMEILDNIYHGNLYHYYK